MEVLANLTRTDVNNGALIRMLADAGIPDVPEYVRQFHQKTEDLILEEFEYSDPEKSKYDEQIVPPVDTQRWITGFRPHFANPNQPPLLVKHQKQQQQQLPADIQSLVTGIRPRLDDPIQSSEHEQQRQDNQAPTDLTSWMQRIAPTGLVSSTDTTPSQTTNTTTSPSEISAVSGNLGTWLNDWTQSLAQPPPPTSLTTWLQSLISTNLHEPIGKATNSKGRLNTYLNAAQQVLSQHGYGVSEEVTPPTNIETKGGMFVNVKQMYFLWRTLDKNNDRKITVEDVQIMLQEMGLGFLSKYVAETLFEMVDSNHDGTLQFRDFIALMGIIKQLIGAVGSAKTKA